MMQKPGTKLSNRQASALETTNDETPAIAPANSIPPTVTEALENMNLAPGWHNGVRVGQYDPELPPAVTMEMNTLGVPSFVMHAKEARKNRQLSYVHAVNERDDNGNVTRIKASFRFGRVGEAPFPLPTHVRYFDAMLAMFAYNWNSSGVLRFRFSDVLRNTGRSADSRGGREAIRETIWRFSHCSSEWIAAFGGLETTWTGPFIKSSSLWEEHARNPRNDKNKEAWHSVTFDQNIVLSIRQKDSMRLMLSDVLKSSIPDDTYCVYRYLRRFTGRESFPLEKGQVRAALSFAGRENDFLKFLEKHLDRLQATGLIHEYYINKTHLRITPVPLQVLQKGKKEGSLTLTLDIETMDKKAVPASSTTTDLGRRTVIPAVSIALLSKREPQQILDLVKPLSAQGLLSDEAISTLAEIRSRQGIIKASTSLITYLQANWAKYEGTVLAQFDHVPTSSVTSRKTASKIKSKAPKKVVRAGATLAKGFNFSEDESLPCDQSAKSALADDLKESALPTRADDKFNSPNKLTRSHFSLSEMLNVLNPDAANAQKPGSGEFLSASEEDLDKMEAAIRQARARIQNKKACEI